ncbi:hypothetical protein OIO90_000312 [Microbotryomycetes sp. JL221]|nr:hypothetical protein OIO90_000312 [Microbotryomycetes sp. JL221]
MRVEALVALAVAAASPVLSTKTVAKRRYVPDVPAIDDEAGLFERYVAAQLRTYKDHLPRRRTAKMLRPARNARDVAFSDTFGSPTVRRVGSNFESPISHQRIQVEDDQVEPVYSHLTGLEALLAQRRKLTDVNGQVVNKRQAKLAYRQSLLNRFDKRSDVTSMPVNEKKRSYVETPVVKKDVVYEGSARAIEKRTLVDHSVKSKSSKRRLHRRAPKDDQMEWTATRQSHVAASEALPQSNQLVLEEGDMDGEGWSWSEGHVQDERDPTVVDMFDDREPPLKMTLEIKKNEASPLM